MEPEKIKLNEALVKAAKDKNLEDVKKLVEQGADVNYRSNISNLTPLDAGIF